MKKENELQNRESEAWIKLCEVIDRIAEEGKEEFSPYEELGEELFLQIYTLPESISKLKKVKKLWLYGSKIKLIPPEIGEMENLEYFDPYTSYDLHWFPYEITNCKNLKDSRVSTRALYGNDKNRMEFPDLRENPIRYHGENLNCSICKKRIDYEGVNQVWITIRVATDNLPLLANLCSKDCESKLQKPPKNYVNHAHKGGKELNQPLGEYYLSPEKRKEILEKLEERKKEENSAYKFEEAVDSGLNENSLKKLELTKLVRKIWDNENEN